MHIDIKKLKEAVSQAASFKLPEMDSGTNYLYEDIYIRMLHGEEVRLSEINFSAFQADDIDSFIKLHKSTLEKNEIAANNIITALQKIKPGYVPVAFV